MLAVEARTPDFVGKRALVTGGTGFIGGRLVERLSLVGDSKVRVLVSDLSRAARIARFPIEMAVGDITRFEDVERAMRGCDVVFHCAYGNKGSPSQRRKVNVEGTRNVMEAALANAVARVVHTSTVTVYGHTRTEYLDESAPRRYSGNPYADSKLDAENVVFRFLRRHRLPATVVQPTVVFGPNAPSWTVRVINLMKTGRVTLVDGGEGVCNAVYIDDVVTSLLHAATRAEALGEAFLISGERPVTWGQFFARFERMLGGSRTVAMTLREAEAHTELDRRTHGIAFQLWSSFFANLGSYPEGLGGLPSLLEAISTRLLAAGRAQAVLRKIARAPRGTYASGKPSPEQGPIHPWSEWSLRAMLSPTKVRIDKAKRLLGYRPRFDFDSGMMLTEKWAAWANLLGPREG